MTNKIIHIDDEIKQLIEMGVDPKHLSVRDGRGSTKYYYIKQGVLTEYLNEAFGCLGWDLKVGEPKIERGEETRTRRGNKVQVNAFEVIIKVTLRIKARTIESSDTVFEHYGIGTGEADVGQSAKDALGMAIKGAESDGFKRCAAHLGKRFGLLLTQQGTQSLIDYAQANNEGRRREMTRAAENEGSGQRGRQHDDQPSRPRREDGDRQPSARANDRDDNRRNEGNDRVAGRREEAQNDRSDRNDNRAGSRGGSDRDTRSNAPAETPKNSPRQEDKREEPKPKDEPSKEKPDNSDAKADTGKAADKQPPEVSDQYDLEILPMTRPEQASFAKTLLRVVGEGKPAERENLVRKHYDVVKDLESKVKKHFVKMLQEEHNIDFNAIRR